jgi:hypothetical protein
LLYARVDLVPGPDGAPVLMELELTEPQLYFGVVPEAAARFAAAASAFMGLNYLRRRQAGCRHQRRPISTRR